MELLEKKSELKKGENKTIFYNIILTSQFNLDSGINGYRTSPNTKSQFIICKIGKE